MDEIIGMVEQKIKYIKPQKNFQELFAKSNADVVFGGGVLSSGKSFALVLAMAEPLMTDSSFRSLIGRKSLGNLKAGGGFTDTFSEIFGDYVRVKQADSPRISFPNGAYCDLTYLDDSNMDKFRERAKGWQYDCIAIDEITEMPWEVFTYIQTRNRGRSKTFTGKFFATLNPKKSHWTRKWLDWYIGNDGFIRPDRDGCIRYFYINGSTVDDVVWGDSKEEVYAQAKIDIDRKLAKVGGDFTYKNMIKSFVFYQGRMSDNRAILDSNPDYIGSVAASGGRMAQALLEGNFNVDADADDKIPIPNNAAKAVFLTDEQRNGDKWITCDLADTGTDNFVALVWDGLHVIDKLILGHTTPRDNAMRLQGLAAKWNIADDHIIYDAIRGTYINDYIPEAVQFVSYRAPMGMYGRMAYNLKAECYLRLVKLLNLHKISICDEVAKSIYAHQNIKQELLIENEFLEECSVVRFQELPSGKKRLMTKKEMNAMLGKGRSMDLLDPFAMRMLPLLEYEYGTELESTMCSYAEENEDIDFSNNDNSIYNESTWA